MATQFRNIDMKGPQRLRIEWAMETPDDDSMDSPEGDGDGFWPSRDPEACGYVAPDRFDEAQDQAQARYDAFHAGDWGWIGVIAVAHAFIPIGGGSYAIHTFRSSGLWGIESDSGAYLAEVYANEKAWLLEQLRTLGSCLTPGEFDESER